MGACQGACGVVFLYFGGEMSNVLIRIDHVGDVNEMTALRTDAERYRWLRSVNWDWEGFVEIRGEYVLNVRNEDLDDEIDKSMSSPPSAPTWDGILKR